MPVNINNVDEYIRQFPAYQKDTEYYFKSGSTGRGNH